MLGVNVSSNFYAPPLKLCTDNAAMIAWAGLERFKLGKADGLDFKFPKPAGA
jgi:N6-L-threonylcarbamoyladenine synthase